MAKKKSGLVEDAIEARRLGMTYGQYKVLEQQGLLEDYRRRFEKEQLEKTGREG